VYLVAADMVFGMRGEDGASGRGVDILYVSCGTTAGLRYGDATVVAALRGCGVTTALLTWSFSASDFVRRHAYRTVARADVYESLALSHVARRAAAACSPRAIIYGTTHAALLQPTPPPGRRIAIRFDTPAQMSRLGRRFRLEHILERRRFRAATCLLPWGVTVTPEMREAIPPGPSVVPLPIPIEGRSVGDVRQPIVVAYAGNPEKKGLHIITEAWRRSEVGDRRLVICGITRSDGLRFLSEQGLNEPERVDWLGLLQHDDFRELTARAEVVVAAARYENHGIAQLEALADGALLVTVPSEGPFAALEVARSLAPGLVAADRSADELASALTFAFAFDDAARRRYRARSAELIRQHSRETLESRLRDDVLPLLLS
jgi:glycosyltransferase involved in cell wall biosynthesis